MTCITHQQFRGIGLWLDGYTFDSCTFEDCHFIYFHPHSEVMRHFSNCSIIGCVFHDPEAEVKGLRSLKRRFKPSQGPG